MREAFGQEWLDADRNGCDTRNDMLGRDLTAKTYDPKTRGCVVLSGTLVDPYTATRIEYVRGDGTLVDVDHVVALGNAWATGAYRWQIGKAAAFANDPMNLLPVEASANRQKGDGDAATWLPPNKVYRCAYVARQVAVKAKYGLWVTEPERAAVARVLEDCPGQRLPADSGAPVLVSVNLPAAPRAPQAGTSPGSGNEVYFENCEAAVVVAGDLNDEPQAATTQILHGPPGSEVGTGGFDWPDAGDAQRLWNTAGFLEEAERWSRVYRGRRELIDHVLVSHSLIGAIGQATTGGVEVESIGDQPSSRRNAPASDHRPVLVDIAAP